MTEPSLSAASRRAGLNRKTIQKYLRNPAFLEAYKLQTGKMFDAATVHAKKLVIEALEFMTTCMRDGTNKMSDRLKAANHIVACAFKAHDLQDLMSELEQYEELRHLLSERGIHNGDPGVTVSPQKTDQSE